MTEQLFDYPDPPPPEDPPPGLGQDAQRTWRQKREIEHGVHPATKLALSSVVGQTCGNCAELWHKRSRSFEGWKCAGAIGVGNDGPDIRKWWPGCVLWKEVAPCPD